MADHQFLLDYECKLKQRDKLERISKELIVRGIGKKISDLRSFQYWAILAKLDEPYRRKNVELVMHRLLQNDLDISTDILKKVDDLRAKIEVQEMPKTIFTAREVHIVP